MCPTAARKVGSRTYTLLGIFLNDLAQRVSTLIEPVMLLVNVAQNTLYRIKSDPQQPNNLLGITHQLLMIRTRLIGCSLLLQ